MPTRQQFLETFKYNPDPKQDFVIAGKPARWASGEPKEWGDESDSFQIEDSITESEKAYTWIHSAISPDQKLIAITSKAGKIGVYDVATHELRAVLEGMNDCIFKPDIADNTGIDNDEALVDRPAYTLLTSVSHETSRTRAKKRSLVFWDLDKNGRVLDAEEEIDAASFATKAIDSILPELEDQHEWTREFVDSSTLHSEFSRALSEIAATHRIRHNTVIKGAQLTGCNSNPFSSDGKKLVYITNETNPSSSESHGPNTRHKVVVYDVEGNKPLHTHSGHTDNIMWTGFSPNGQYVASVAWDGKLRMFSAVTGEDLYSVGDTDRQAWTASFSPDSRFIVWSSQNGKAIQVHSVTDGALLSTFPSDSLKLRNWCRNVSWHPEGERILLSVDQRVFIWRPFDKFPASSDSGSGEVIQTYEMHADKSRFFDIASAQFLDEGRKVVICSSEGTTLVWDERTNSKELFKRPDGLLVGWVDRNLYLLGMGDGEGTEVFLSVGGDAKVRCWKTGFGGLDDADEGTDLAGDGNKEDNYESPERTVDSRKETQEKAEDTGGSGVREGSTGRASPRSEGTRDVWAERGAGLWTAE